MNIYSYSTETYRYKRDSYRPSGIVTSHPWFKIGETTNEVEIRIQQQDGTSNPESLDELMRWENSKYTDKNLRLLKFILRNLNHLNVSARRFCNEIISVELGRRFNNLSLPQKQASSQSISACIIFASCM